MAKKFKPGDMWSSDFDYDGMLDYGRKIDGKTSDKQLDKYADSMEDVNYHTLAKPLFDYQVATSGDKERIKKYYLRQFKRGLSDQLAELGEERLSFDDIYKYKKGGMAESCSKCGGEGEIEIKNHFDDGRGDYVWEDCDECNDEKGGSVDKELAFDISDRIYFTVIEELGIENEMIDETDEGTENTEKGRALFEAIQESVESEMKNNKYGLGGYLMAGSIGAYLGAKNPSSVRKVTDPLDKAVSDIGKNITGKKPYAKGGTTENMYYITFNQAYGEKSWAEVPATSKKEAMEKLKKEGGVERIVSVRKMDNDEYAKGGMIPFSSSNLYFNSFGKDSNGNSVIKVSFPNSRAFSIQTNGDLPKTHSLKQQYSKIENLSDEDLKIVEKEVTDYVKEFGSDTQIKKLNTYAKGGSVEDKEYVLERYYVYVSRDSYEEGELDNVHNWDSSDMQENNKTFSSKSDLMDFIKEVIDRDTQEDKTIDDYFMIESDDDETTIDYSVLCKYNALGRGYDNYEKASDEEIEKWKKGDLELFSVGFTFKVKVYEPRKKAEFERGGKTKTQQDFLNKWEEEQRNYYEYFDDDELERDYREWGLGEPSPELTQEDLIDALIEVEKPTLEKAEKYEIKAKIDEIREQSGAESNAEEDDDYYEEHPDWQVYAKGGDVFYSRFSKEFFEKDGLGAKYVSNNKFDDKRYKKDMIDRLQNTNRPVSVIKIWGRNTDMDVSKYIDGVFIEDEQFAIDNTKQAKKLYTRKYSQGGEVKKKEKNEMIIGGLAGVLLGIFLNK